MLKYHILRSETLAYTKAELLAMLGADEAYRIELTEITRDALNAELAWSPDADLAAGRSIGWDWEEAVRHYRYSYPARMELAIWLDGSLCGLMLGKPSVGKLVVKLNYIQGAPVEHDLKGRVVPIAILYAEHYASMLGAEWLGIQDPLDEPDLLDYYRALGFTEPDPFDPRNNALFKKL